MIKRSLQEIISMAEGIELLDPSINSPDRNVHGVSIDSRTLSAGNLFIPIVRIDDGHKYVEQAFEKGASASLWQIDHPSPPQGKPIILVKDTLKALQCLAKTYRHQLNTKVVGVTGSNGKTTVKDMVNCILGTTYKVQKTYGNLNGEYGLPLSLLEVDEDTEVVILEMGMSNKGEIKLLSEIAKPDIGIITMIGVSHLSSLGSREAITLAKMEILSGLNPEGAYLYNGDEPLLLNELGGRKFPETLQCVRFGESSINDYYPIKVKSSQTGLSFYSNKHTTQFHVPLLGKHNVVNALVSIIVGDLFNVSVADIQIGLKNLELSAMRMERIPTQKGFLIINDAWNASPISMKSAITTVKNLEGYNKKILVLGDMLELGESEQEFHIEIANYIELLKIDFVYTYGKVSRAITDTLIVSSFEGDAKHFTSKKDLAYECLQILDKNDVILIKGSRGLRLEEVCDILLEA